MDSESTTLCACDCGQPVRPGKQFRRGHHWKTLTLAARFWPHVIKTETCWLWTGGRTWNGYGVLFEHNKATRYRVHRLSYEWHVGPIPPGLDVCHRCDVRNCVRPEHLFVGTRADNLADMRAKGRAEDGTRRARGSANPTAKMDEETVLEVRRRAAAGERQADIGRALGLTNERVSSVVLRRTWTHV